MKKYLLAAIVCVLFNTSTYALSKNKSGHKINTNNLVKAYQENRKTKQ